MIVRSFNGWQPTREAAVELGVSRATLIRLSATGVLKVGEHVFCGPHANSPKMWDVEKSRQAIIDHKLASYTSASLSAASSS